MAASPVHWSRVPDTVVMRTSGGLGGFLAWGLARFRWPTLLAELGFGYAVGMAFLVVEFAIGRKALLAPKYFWETVRAAQKRDRPAPP